MPGIARYVRLSRLHKSVQRMANTRGDSNQGAPKKCSDSLACEPEHFFFSWDRSAYCSDLEASVM